MWSILDLQASGWGAALGIALLAVAIVALLTRKNTPVWGPTELPIIGNLWFLLWHGRQTVLDATLLGCQLANFTTWTAKWVGSPRWFLTTDPKNVEHILKTRFDNYPKGKYMHDILYDLLGDGIFASDGQRWDEQRKTASFMFSAREFRENIVRVFHAHGRILLELLNDAARTGKQVDLFSLFNRFTLDSIGEIAFGVTIDSLRQPDTPFARAFDDAQSTVDLRFTTPLWWAFKWVLPREYKLRRSIKVLDAFCYDLIRQRRQEGGYLRRHDVLSRFMSMTDEHGAPLHLHDDKYLRDVVLNFIIAGRDTTAQALSWTVYCLSRNQQHVPRIIAEADTAVSGSQAVAASSGSASRAEAAAAAGGSNGEGNKSLVYTPSYDDVLIHLPFTQAVVKETLRLYPSVPKDLKTSIADDTLPDGTFVPKGSSLIYMPYCMGRSKALWGPDCEDFRPERFLGEEGRYSPFQYIVFNAGRRTCLGQHMALVEASYVLSLLYRHFDVTLVPGHPVKIMDSLTLPMQHGLLATVKERHPASQQSPATA